MHAQRLSLDPGNRSALFRKLAACAHRAEHSTVLLGPGIDALSFGRLMNEVESIAARLSDAGIRSNDIVAIANPSESEFLVTLLGVMRVASAAPLDPVLSEAELSSRLSRLGAAALITRSQAASTADAIKLTSGQTRRRVPDDVALILESSGTLGAPNLVPLTHANLNAMAAALEDSFDLSPDDRLLSILPLHHLLGVICALAQLLSGGSVAFMGAFDAQRFLIALGELRPTWYAASPTIHHAILRAAENSSDGIRSGSLRFARCGSAAIDPDVLASLERILGIPIVNGYGLTEAGPVAHTSAQHRKSGSVGRSIGPVIGIMDAAGTLMSAGRDGEVVLRGDSVTPGYLDDAANSAAFRDGWFHTGDLGHIDSDGDLFITGRIKETINRGGETISPLEIDAALTAHAAVQEAAAFAIPHPTLGDDIAAAILLRNGADVSEADLRRFLATRLSRAKMPSRFFFVDAIPRGATGKPKRKLLSEKYAAPPWPTAPRNETSDNLESFEESIAGIWEHVLKRSPARDDNFFAAGGDSLALTVLLTAIQTDLNLSSEIWQRTELFEQPTVANLARIAAECPSDDSARGPRFADPGCIVLQDAGDDPPFFFFPGAFLGADYLRHLAHVLGKNRPFIVLGQSTSNDAQGIPDFHDAVNHAVDCIRRLHPSGPYLLGGHCYGGVQAFETAIRLSRLGAPAPLVALFDTPTPGYPKPMKRWRAYLKHARGRLTHFRLAEIGDMTRDAAGHVKFLYSRRKPIVAVAETAAAAPTLPSPQPATVMRTYVPQPFSGAIVHFLAGDQAVTSRVLEDARLSWREFALGGFEVVRTTGSHRSLFEESNAGQMAGRLRDVLETATRRHSHVNPA